MPFMATHRRGTGRFLHWKVRLFFIGAVLLLVGMTREFDVLVGIALAILAAAFVLRFFEGEKAEETPADDDELEEDEELAGDLPASTGPHAAGPATRQVREERPVE